MKTTELVPVERFLPDAVREKFQDLHESAVEFENASTSKNTQVAYQRAWTRFENWCAAHSVPSLPTTAQVLRLYITDAAKKGIPHLDGTPGRPMGRRSIDVHLSAIIFVHDYKFKDQDGFVNPARALSEVFIKGVRRGLRKPAKKKMHITLKQLYAAVASIPNTFRGKRDRAVLLCAFAAGGRRRSEVVAMRREDIVKTAEGDWLWTVAESKTDQEGAGFVVAIPKLKKAGGCPATALDAWLAASRISTGPVFPGLNKYDQVVYREGPGNTLLGAQPRLVATLMKQMAEKLKLDPSVFAGHSIRSGFATDMATKGMRLEDIMARTGHKSVAVVQGYIRAGRMLSQEDVVRKALDTED